MDSYMDSWLTCKCTWESYRISPGLQPHPPDVLSEPIDTEPL